jgi:hypothetical protein
MKRRLRVIVGCERSGKIRDAFRRLGHEAWSNDLEFDEHGKEIIPQGEWPNYHLFGDVRWFLDGPYGPWDLAIFHPPCTYLTNAGVRWLYKCDGTRNEPRWHKLDEGAALFRDLLKAPIERVAIENPIMHKHAVERIGGIRQSQTIQPWQFGHMEQKATGLWLRNLPLLKETNNVRAEMLKLPNSQRQRIFHMSPGPDRTEKRSETFDGIADAMADQWSRFILEMEGMTL